MKLKTLLKVLAFVMAILASYLAYYG